METNDPLKPTTLRDKLIHEKMGQDTYFGVIYSETSHHQAFYISWNCNHVSYCVSFLFLKIHQTVAFQVILNSGN